MDLSADIVVSTAEAAPVDGDRSANGTIIITAPDVTFLRANLSVLPRQPRSVTTLDRLIAATRSIGLREGEEAVTLKAVAKEANVGAKAVYRYFSSPGDLIRVAIRAHVLGQYKTMRRRIERTDYVDIDHLASDLTGYIVERFLDESLAPRKLKQRLFEVYTSLAHGEIQVIAEAMIAAMRRCGLTACGEPNAAEVAIVLGGVGGAARQAFQHHPETFEDGRFRRMAHAQIALALAG